MPRAWIHAASTHLLAGEIEERDGLVRRQLRRGSSQPATGCRQARAQLGDRTLGHAPLLAVVQQRAHRRACASTATISGSFGIPVRGSVF